MMKKPEDVFSNLQIKVDAIRIPLPDWAKYFTFIGYEIGSIEIEYGNNLIIPIIVPTINYASVFISLGVILKRVLLNEINDDNLLEKFRNMNIGQSLKFRCEDYWMEGIFQGISRRMGVTYVDVKTEKGRKGISGSLIRYIPLKTAGKCLELFDKEVKLHGVQKAKKHRLTNSFIDSICKYGYIEEYLTTGKRLDSLIIGSKARVIREIQDVELFLDENNEEKPIGGKMSNILRPIDLMHYHEAFRTIISPGMSRSGQSSFKDLTPFLTIYDGSIPYLNSFDNTPGKINIVLLDRTEKQLPLAIDKIIVDYSHRDPGKSSIEFPGIIPGIEYTSFEVKSAT